MKFKVIRGEKDKSKSSSRNKPVTEKPSAMEDYYAKERPRPQEMEQAEGDEDIVEAALKNQRKRGKAA